MRLQGQTLHRISKSPKGQDVGCCGQLAVYAIKAAFAFTCGA